MDQTGLYRSGQGIILVAAYQTRKKLGCCSMCDAEVFEARTRYPPDHSLSKEIRQVGKCLDGAKRMTFVLANGSQTDFTFCNSCNPQPRHLPDLWKKTMAAMALQSDPAHRVAIGAGQLNSSQLAEMKRGLLKLANTPPLGVLYQQSWSEVQENG